MTSKTTRQPPRMTKTERIAREGLMKNLIHLHRDGWITSVIADEVPEAWHTLEADLDVEETKQKVTLYLDQSVVRFYRAMGKGYQARINRLLATWAQMKIAGEVQLDEHLKKRLGYREPGPDEAQAAQDEPDEGDAIGENERAWLESGGRISSGDDDGGGEGPVAPG